MTTQEIYKLANELTKQQVLNVLKGWENENDKESLENYNILLKLGDSMQMSCATIIAQKINKFEDSEMYQIAYYS